jgi:hypothetical protein
MEMTNQFIAGSSIGYCYGYVEGVVDAYDGRTFCLPEGHRCCAGSWRRCSPGSTKALRRCSLALRLDDGDVDLARGQEHVAALKQ